jgi:cell division septal protein FtsQ
VAKRKKQQNSKNFLKDIFANKFILVGLLCAVIAIGVFYGLWQFFHNDKFFTIDEIVVSEEGNYSLWEGEARFRELYVGRNIFDVNPKDLEIMIKQEAPQLKTVVVRRVMPNKLEMDITPRMPIAFIDSGHKDIIIDTEGVVLSQDGGTKDLPQVKGVRFFFSSPSVGERINNAMLSRALMLLESLRQKGLSAAFPVRDVDVSDRNNIQLDIIGIKVKMGSGGFPDNINRLKEILEDPEVDTSDIEYIDLRFEKAIISPK